MTPAEIHDLAVERAQAFVLAHGADPRAALVEIVGPDVADVLAGAEGGDYPALQRVAYDRAVREIEGEHAND